MIFKPIDWDQYNQPPFLPQWMCKDETLEMARFDDSLRIDLDQNIRALVDQYDIENIKGALLDRIGKILAEPRNGNDDEFYLLLLKLRILLNTTNGSINDVIKVIKFIYSSEVVHITPNFPAGLSILHDGEAPNLDFNKIIAAVVPAGVAYDTKELFYFKDLFPSHDEQRIVVRADMREAFFGQIYHNGRILRDGHTIRDIQKTPFRHDGKHIRDGKLLHQAYFWEKAYSVIRLPLLHGSGCRDRLMINIKPESFIDEHLAQLFRNGSVVRDGSVKHNGISNTSINETVFPMRFNVPVTEIMPSIENHQITVRREMVDTMTKGLKHNGFIIRNGSVYRNNEIAENQRLNFIVEPFSDLVAGTIRRNGSIRRDGTEYHRRIGTQVMYERLRIGIRKHHFHNGAYTRNGNIRHDGMILIPLE